MDMKAAELGTAMQLRKHLAGIEQPLGVKSAFHALLLIKVEFRKHRRHQIPLLNANAVLSGKNAANLDTKFKDVCAEFLGPLQLAGHIGVVENKRMQIAVAGMENIGNTQAIFR